MMNRIWAFLIIISFVCAVATGRMEALSQGILEGTGSAVNLVISTMGMMCLWTGFMKIAKKSGMTTCLARLFSPVLKRLFPDYAPDSPAMGAITMNVTANLLGLGNAATPFGLKAMQEMQKARPDAGSVIANKSMVLFVVLNTASIQLIPTFLGTIRMQYCSQSPFGILPGIWITSLCGVVVGVSLVMVLYRKKTGKHTR